MNAKNHPEECLPRIHTASILTQAYYEDDTFLIVN